MNKILAGVSLLAALGWGLFWWTIKHPVEIPKLVTQTKYVDRVVDRQTVKETTRPDGTKIREVTVSKSQDKTVSVSKASTGSQSQWSLGVTTSIPLPSLIDSKPIYGVLVGYRIGGPLWISTGLNVKRELTLGLSMQF